MTRLCFLPLLSVFAGLAGCDPPEPTGPLLVELGSGLDRFDPIGAGTELPILQGPQGGYHVILNVRATNPGSSAVLLLSGTLPNADTACLGYYPGVSWQPDPQVVGAVALERGVRCFVDSPSRVIGMAATLTAELTRKDGTVTRDSREVILGPIVPLH